MRMFNYVAKSPGKDAVTLSTSSLKDALQTLRGTDFLRHIIIRDSLFSLSIYYTSGAQSLANNLTREPLNIIYQKYDGFNDMVTKYAFAGNIIVCAYNETTKRSKSVSVKQCKMIERYVNQFDALRIVSRW